MFLIDPTSTSPALPKFKLLPTMRHNAPRLLKATRANSPPTCLMAVLPNPFLETSPSGCPLADPQYTPPIATKTRQCHPSFPEGIRPAAFLSKPTCDTLRLSQQQRVDARLPFVMEVNPIKIRNYAYHAAHNVPRLPEATRIDTASLSVIRPIFKNRATAAGSDTRRRCLVFLDGGAVYPNFLNENLEFSMPTIQGMTRLGSRAEPRRHCPVTVANLLANQCRATATSVGNDVTSTASQNPARCSSEHEATGGESAGGRAV
ncbi:hypothetical protein C8J57DRAFT_1607015 [Mycena rebaudengoi]|nr:hypothetical protein C8J57DRAFT_1607015 [Mycena rebaudengoi]